MKVFFCSLFLCVNLVFNGTAQTTKVFYEKKEQEFVIYADNNEWCPVSLTINLDLSNLAFSDKDKKVFVIPFKTERYIIGTLSGNVGWSSGPHLHFASFLPAFDKWQTLETKFRINNGENVVLLMEGKEYKRDY